MELERREQKVRGLGIEGQKYRTLLETTSMHSGHGQGFHFGFKTHNGL